MLDESTCEMVLKKGHNICFYEKIWKIIPSYPHYPFLYGALANSEEQSNGLVRP